MIWPRGHVARWHMAVWPMEAMMRRRLTVALMWAASLALVATAASGGQLQLQRPTRVDPTVVSGSDFGFRITGTRGGHAVGTLVVRQKGQWVEADLGMSVKQLSLK